MARPQRWTLLVCVGGVHQITVCTQRHPAGECCVGTLDAAGRCCPSGALDACGVCNGNGASCRLAVLLAADLVSPNNTLDAAGVQQLAVDYVLQGLRLPPSAVNTTTVQMPGATAFGVAAPVSATVNASSMTTSEAPRPMGWVRVVLDTSSNGSEVLRSSDVAVVLAALDSVSTQVHPHTHRCYACVCP